MHCKLREWKTEDAERLAELLNNKSILDNLRDGLPFPYTVADANEYIKSIQCADKNAVFSFAVLYKGEVAGSVGIFRQSNIHFRTAELGYYIGEKFWNRGIATAAIKSACEYVFNNTDIIRIFAEPFSRNKASCRVLEKVGFVCEGVLRSNAVKNGIVEDMKLFSLIKCK